MSGRAMVVGLAILALAVRVAFLFALRPWDPEVERRAVRQGDAIQYEQLAITLKDHGRFAHAAGDPPVASRSPGYPLLLAAVFAAGGHRPWLAFPVQIVLDVAALLVVFAALRRVFGRPAATIAAAFYALDPFLVFYCSMLLGDTLFVFVLACALYALVRALDPEASLAWPLLLGALLGAATLVRPLAQFVPLLVAPFLFHRWRPRFGRSALALVLLAAGFTVVVTPWVVRNQRVFGRPVLSTAGGYQFLILHAAPLLAERTQIPGAAAERALLDRAEARMRASGREPASLDELERSAAYGEVARELIASDPAGFARVTARGVVSALLSVNSSGFALLLGQPGEALDILAHRDPVSLAQAFFATKSAFQVRLLLVLEPYVLLLYLLILLGVIARLRSPGRDVAVLLLILAGLFVVVGGAGSGVRYRLPALPFALGFAGLGAQAVMDFARSRRGRPAARVGPPGPRRE